MYGEEPPDVQAAKMYLPSFMPLPAEPAPAQITASDGSQAPFVFNETVHVLSSTPDGIHVYCLSADEHSERREGWLGGNQLRLLGEGSVPGLPLAATLKRTTLMRAREDWFGDEGNPVTSLELRLGDLVQVLLVNGGSGFGFLLDFPHRRGWFPLSPLEVVDASLMSLLPPQPEELPPGAAEAMKEVLRNAPPPPRRPAAWIGEMPAIVKASSCQEVESFRDMHQRMTTVQVGPVLVEEPGAAAAAGAAGGAAAEAPLNVQDLPEDCHPLVICTQNFEPQRGAQSAMLTLRVGDMLRVTTPLESTMNLYHGFHVGRSEKRGWFPSSHVTLKEDPLNEEMRNIHVEQTVLPLPKIPDWVLQKASA